MSSHKPAMKVAAELEPILQKIRKQIKTNSFDPNSFISQQLNSIMMDANKAESNFLKFFDQLTNQVTVLSQSIEDEIQLLQQSALTMESFLLDELDDQADKLKAVEQAVDLVRSDFEQASHNTVRIGNKLSNTEKERINILKSIELMKYIKEFQSTSETYHNDVLHMNAYRLKDSLPPPLREQDWYFISQRLYELKKILLDINNEDVQHAQRVVLSISEVVELELLGQFDLALEEVMNHYNNNAADHHLAQQQQQQQHHYIEKARRLSECLHLFNNGQSLHKRYIFSVVEKRIPNEAMIFPSSSSTGGNNAIMGNTAGAMAAAGKEMLIDNVKKVLQIKAMAGQHHGHHGDHDDASSSGASSDAGGGGQRDDDDNTTAAGGGISLQKSFAAGSSSSPAAGQAAMPPSLGQQQGHESLTLIDHLSRLFAMINHVCIEQFALIRQIFPSHTIPRVTRQLVQRIFNDPAFGIQARVDAILVPTPPAPPLLLADYLDALLTVREKLSALNVLLQECASDPAMIGMGSEVYSLRKAKKEIVPSTTGPLATATTAAGSATGNAANGTASAASSQKQSTTVAGNPQPLQLQLQQPSASADDNNLITMDEIYYHQQQSEDILLSEERLQSDIEIKEFFYDQSSQVLSLYIQDYFEKEITHLRLQYIMTLRRAVDSDLPMINQAFANAAMATTGNLGGTVSNLSKVSAGTVLTLPSLKYERMKSIQQIVQTVANKTFINSIFVITTDAVSRMESIGRDDKKLSTHIKEVYLLQIGFLVEGVLLPWSKACTMLLIKIAGVKAQASCLPPEELLPALAAFTYTKARINSHFEEVFSRPLSLTPNLLAVCKETKKKYFTSLRKAANECLFAWTTGVAAHLDKILVTLQSRYDYNPGFDGGLSAALASSSGSSSASNAAAMNRARSLRVGGGVGGGGGGIGCIGSHSNRGAALFLDPTPACDAVCKAFIQITNALRRYEGDILDMDLQQMFWRPFGQQFLGILIAHLRRYPISVDGARILSRDLEEYRHVTELMNSPETSDMIACLEEICQLFHISDSYTLSRFILEDLRHLDTTIVLGLAKMRSDFNLRAATSSASAASAGNGSGSGNNAGNIADQHWCKTLAIKYQSYKWDRIFPWEGKKPVTILAFKEIMMTGGGNSQILGPRTLRKGGSGAGGGGAGGGQGGMMGSGSSNGASIYINEAMRVRNAYHQQQQLLQLQQQQQQDQQQQHQQQRSSATAGYSIALDITALERGENIDQYVKLAEKNMIHQLHQQGGSNGGGAGSGNGIGGEQVRLASRFLPTRPDEEQLLQNKVRPLSQSYSNNNGILTSASSASASSSIAGSSNGSQVEKDGKIISRPDLIGVYPKALASSSMMNNNGHPNNNTAVLGTPTGSTHKQRRGSANVLHDVQHQQLHQQQQQAQFTTPVAGGRGSATTPNTNGSSSKPTRGMLSKMTSYFGGGGGGGKG